MPEQETLERAQQDKAEGKAPSTQAGEFIREEMHHIREGKHGARSTKQAIAIGLSKARRAGVHLPPPGKGKASRKTRSSARSAYRAGKSRHKPSPRRSRAIRSARCVGKVDPPQPIARCHGRLMPRPVGGPRPSAPPRRHEPCAPKVPAVVLPPRARPPEPGLRREPKLGRPVECDTASSSSSSSSGGSVIVD